MMIDEFDDGPEKMEVLPEETAEPEHPSSQTRSSCERGPPKQLGAAAAAAASKNMGSQPEVVEAKALSSGVRLLGSVEGESLSRRIERHVPLCRAKERESEGEGGGIGRCPESPRTSGSKQAYARSELGGRKNKSEERKGGGGREGEERSAPPAPPAPPLLVHREAPRRAPA
eukprot:3153735-Rhodomonas_salina.2